jgi:hypothetical protein
MPEPIISEAWWRAYNDRVSRGEPLDQWGLRSPKPVVVLPPPPDLTPKPAPKEPAVTARVRQKPRSKPAPEPGTVAFDTAVQRAVAAELDRRDQEAIEYERATATYHPPPRDPTPEELADRQAFLLAVQVHGSREAAHEVEVAQAVRRHALAARLACRWCGAQAVTYLPKSPLMIYTQGHWRAGLPIEPTAVDHSPDRFAVTADTWRSALCQVHLEHTERGDLACAIARTVLLLAGGDQDDALDPALAHAIVQRVPPHTGRAVDSLWVNLGSGHDRVVACQTLVAEARVDVAEGRERCRSCQEFHVLEGRDECQRCRNRRASAGSMLP